MGKGELTIVTTNTPSSFKMVYKGGNQTLPFIASHLDLIFSARPVLSYVMCFMTSITLELEGRCQTWDMTAKLCKCPLLDVSNLCPKELDVPHECVLDNNIEEMKRLCLSARKKKVQMISTKASTESIAMIHIQIVMTRINKGKFSSSAKPVFLAPCLSSVVDDDVSISQNKGINSSRGIRTRNAVRC